MQVHAYALSLKQTEAQITELWRLVYSEEG